MQLLDSLKLQSSPDYLAHLDGLRSLALLGVLFFHFQVPHFAGGYLGVDMFLTLSGFLITRNILSEIANKSFSLSNFYIRRFFRLYPASNVAALAAVVLAFFTYSASLAFDVCVSALSSMMFMSNVYFHNQAGYFETTANLKPLLHTWSLSLEEQFYFIWPPLIVFVFRQTSAPRRALIVAITLLAFLSFATAVLVYPYRPSFVFFELPARLYQFATGALLALYSFRAPLSARQTIADGGGDDDTRPLVEQVPSASSSLSSDSPTANCAPISVSCASKLLAESSAALALLLSLLCFMVVPNGAPPLHTSIITVCAALLIALSDTIVARVVLSNPIIRYVGTLSYSAYLAHWPLYVFVRHIMSAMSLGHPSPLVLVVVSLLLAWLMQNGVETPLRRWRTTRARRGTAILFAATLLVALTGVLTGGFKFRVSNVAVSRSVIYDKPLPKRTHEEMRERRFCRTLKGRGKGYKSGAVNHCYVGAVLKGKESPFVIVGDSFAQQMMPALHAIGRRRRQYFQLLYRTGCRVEERYPQTKERSLSCGHSSREIWDALEKISGSRKVAVVNSWWFKGENHVYGKLARIHKDLQNIGHELVAVEEPPGLNLRFESYFDCADVADLPLGRVLRSLRRDGREVVSGAEWCVGERTMLEPYNDRHDLHRAYVGALKRDGLVGVQFVSLYDSLCDGKSGEGEVLCRIPTEAIFGDGVYDIGYKRDCRHMTNTGAVLLADVFEKGFFGNVTALPEELP